MNISDNRRQRILVGLLIASWTLIVALGVALLTQNRFPPGAFFPGSFPGSRFDRHEFKDRFGEGRKRFREDLEPFIAQRQNYILALSTEFAKDSLDTARIHALSDSLDQLMRGMKGKALERMIRMHGEMPLEARLEVLPRMMRHFGMEPGERSPCATPGDTSLRFPRREFRDRHSEKKAR